MTYHRGKRPSTVREPVQVYLDGPDKERLERLARRLDATKSDVLRRGLEALEHEISDPARHPALRIAGILDGSGRGVPDAAREHDRILAEEEEASWTGSDVG